MTMNRPMSLETWSDRYDVLPTARTEKGYTSVVLRPSQPAYLELWYLTDYAVSAVRGSVVWLKAKD